jgi:rubrerythrin
MSFDSNSRSTQNEVSNKEETEIPIGEPRDPESQAHTMWRCQECGEMGRLVDTLSEECPGCTGRKEELYYWEED